MFGAIAGGIAAALAGGAMSKLFGGGQKAASGGILGDVIATDNNTVGMGDAGIKSAIQGSRSVWRIAGIHARTPTGMLRKILQTINTSAVPVISIGGTLNARI